MLKTSVVSEELSASEERSFSTGSPCLFVCLFVCLLLYRRMDQPPQHVSSLAPCVLLQSCSYSLHTNVGTIFARAALPRPVGRSPHCCPAVKAKRTRRPASEVSRGHGLFLFGRTPLCLVARPVPYFPLSLCVILRCSRGRWRCGSEASAPPPRRTF
jgi:hypothetical protein